MGEFQREQEAFEKRQLQQRGEDRWKCMVRSQRQLVPTADAAVPPWVGYNEEDQMKAQILELSSVSVLPSSLPPSCIISFSFRTVAMCCGTHLLEWSSHLTTDTLLQLL